MWIQYLFAALLIVAVFVFVFRKSFQRKESFTITKKSKKAKLVHSETGLTMDDHYRLDKRNKELEMNNLLDKVNAKGYDKLSEKEKLRLKELSEGM